MPRILQESAFNGEGMRLVLGRRYAVLHGFNVVVMQNLSVLIGVGMTAVRDNGMRLRIDDERISVGEKNGAPALSNLRLLVSAASIIREIKLKDLLIFTALLFIVSASIVLFMKLIRTYFPTVKLFNSDSQKNFMWIANVWLPSCIVALFILLAFIDN